MNAADFRQMRDELQKNTDELTYIYRRLRPLVYQIIEIYPESKDIFTRSLDALYMPIAYAYGLDREDFPDMANHDRETLQMPIRAHLDKAISALDRLQKDGRDPRKNWDFADKPASIDDPPGGFDFPNSQSAGGGGGSFKSLAYAWEGGGGDNYRSQLPGQKAAAEALRDAAEASKTSIEILGTMYHFLQMSLHSLSAAAISLGYAVFSTAASAYAAIRTKEKQSG